MSVGKVTIPTNLSETNTNRFWSKVGFTANPNCCWEYNGTINKGGYGYIDFIHEEKRIKLKAHRLSYFLTNKKDPVGYVVMHKCDNRKCCNPKHLELGSDNDNLQYCKNKGRNNRGEQNIHAKRTKEQILEIRKLFSDGIMSRHEIARQFKMPYNSVVSIILRRDWKHI